MSIRCLALGLSLTLSLTACSTAQYLEMVPSSLSRSAPTHKSLTVLPIKTAIKTDRSTPLETETFYLALSAALAKTGMFKTVQSDLTDKGYRLETSLTRQKLHFKDRAAHFNISTRYAFVDRYNQVVYTTDISTRCHKTPGDHTIGAKRERRAIECAVKQNLSTLLDRLYTAQHQFR